MHGMCNIKVITRLLFTNAVPQAGFLLSYEISAFKVKEEFLIYLENVHLNPSKSKRMPAFLAVSFPNASRKLTIFIFSLNK